VPAADPVRDAQDTPPSPEPTKQRPGDQPLPTDGRECVQDALIAHIKDRKQLGIQRYGSPLMTHNGRDAIRDAREEAVDLAMYLMQVELETRDLRADLASAQTDALALDQAREGTFAQLATVRAELAEAREERIKYGTECKRLTRELDATHERARTLIRRLKDVKEERDTAQSQVAAGRALAAEMRTWCSPHNIAVDYADRIDEAFDGAAAQDCVGSDRKGTS
jgi:hypothetical protein